MAGKVENRSAQALSTPSLKGCRDERYLAAIMPVFCNIFKLLAASALYVLGLGAALAAEAPAGGVTLENHIQPLLKQYCFDCHNAEKAKGDINLVDVAKNPKLIENREVWNKVIE